MSIQNKKSLLARLARVVNDLRLLVINVEQFLHEVDKLLLRIALILFLIFDFVLVFYVLYVHFKGK
jgi:hypothetical protein